MMFQKEFSETQKRQNSSPNFNFTTNFITNDDLPAFDSGKEVQSLGNSLTVSSIIPNLCSIERKNYHLELNIEEERYSLPLIIR